jgi:hypothetical protein
LYYIRGDCRMNDSLRRFSNELVRDGEATADLLLRSRRAGQRIDFESPREHQKDFATQCKYKGCSCLSTGFV